MRSSRELSVARDEKKKKRKNNGRNNNTEHET